MQSENTKINIIAKKYQHVIHETNSGTSLIYGAIKLLQKEKYTQEQTISLIESALEKIKAGVDYGYLSIKQAQKNE